MARTLTIVGLGGSIASVSRSHAALEVALEGAASAGANTQLLDLRELELPMFNPEDDEPTAGAVELIEASHAADGMLWSSPLYQGTISGALENALDWIAPARRARAAVPPRQGDRAYQHRRRHAGLQAINPMEFATRALRGWAVPYVVPVAAAARVFDREGRIHDQAVELRLKTLGGEVVRVAQRFAADASLHRQAECQRAAEHIAAAG